MMRVRLLKEALYEDLSLDIRLPVNVVTACLTPFAIRRRDIVCDDGPLRGGLTRWLRDSALVNAYVRPYKVGRYEQRLTRSRSS